MANIAKDHEYTLVNPADDAGSPPPSPSKNESSIGNTDDGGENTHSSSDKNDDDDDGDTVSLENWEKKNEKIRKSNNDVKRARIAMTMLHFFLSYPRWSVSIFLFLASRSVPLVSNLSDAAIVPYEVLHNLTRAEANAYHECTLHAFEHLKEEMNEAVHQEHQKVLSHRQSNQALLAHVGSTTGTCAIAGLKAREALFQWNVSESQALPFLNVSTITHSGVCSAEDREYIATSLGQDFEALEGEVSSILSSYAQSSESSFGRIAHYTEERTDYDYNFFVRERIEPVLELLQELAATSLYTVQFAFEPQNLIDRLLEHLKAFDMTLSTAKIRLQLLSSRIEEFYISLEKFVDAYNELYRRLVLARNLALEYLPNGALDLPDYLQLDGIPLAASLLPPIFAVPTFQTELDEFDILLHDFSEQALLLIVELVQKLQEEANKALASATKEILHQIIALLTLEDYDPPKFVGSQPEIENLEDEAAYLSEIGEAAQASSKQALEKANDLRNTTVGGDSFDIPEIDTGNYSFSGNATTFD